MKKKKWITLLSAPFVLWLLWICVCAAALNYSSKVAELQSSIGDYVRINDARGNPSYGTLGCAEIIPADGTFRFKVTLLRIGPDGQTAARIYSMTLSFWQLHSIEVVKKTLLHELRDAPDHRLH